MDLVWAADPTLDTDRPTLMAGLIPKYTKFSFQILEKLESLEI